MGLTNDRPMTIFDEEATHLTIDVSMFDDGDKATALIQHLDLTPADTLLQKGDFFIVNKREELTGLSPKEYEKEARILKSLCTKNDMVLISKEIKRKGKKFNEVLYDQLKKKIEKKAESILNGKDDTAKEEVTWLKEKSFHLSNLLYSLFEKGQSQGDKALTCAWLEKEVSDIRTYHEKDDGEYRVLTDAEADTAADDSLDEDQWKMCVEGGHTTEGYEDWKESVLNSDGRGHTLNHYDGSEESETVDGTEYYIYRTN